MLTYALLKHLGSHIEEESPEMPQEPSHSQFLTRKASLCRFLLGHSFLSSQSFGRLDNLLTAVHTHAELLRQMLW